MGAEMTAHELVSFLFSLQSELTIDPNKSTFVNGLVASYASCYLILIGIPRPQKYNFNAQMHEQLDPCMVLSICHA